MRPTATLALALALPLAVGAARPAAAHAQAERRAAEFLVDRRGASWAYDGPLGPAEVVTVVEKAASGEITVRNADQNVGGSSELTWRLADGAWTERFSARGPRPVVLLPARLTVGTRWEWTYTDLLGATGTHRFQVTALADTVVLKSGEKVPRCLRVEEHRPDLGDMPVVHWFAAGKGEVAVQVGGSWYRSLSHFTPGGKKVSCGL
jgi:hypothetical protein